MLEVASMEFLPFWRRSRELPKPRVLPLWVYLQQILVAFLALQTVVGAKIHVVQ